MTGGDAMGDGPGSLVLFAATLCGALLASATTAGLTLAGAFTPPPAGATGPDLDETPLTWQERMDRARPFPRVGVVDGEAYQVRESRLARQRVEMLGHTYAVELVASEYVAYTNTAVYRAKEGGAFVDFRVEVVGRDKKAAADSLAGASWGNPSLTFVVRSGGRTLRSDYRIGAVGDPRGFHPTVRVVWPGPISVPDVEGAEYWITVDGKRHDVAP